MRNRDSAALAAFQAAELLARRLASPHYAHPLDTGIACCWPWCGSARPGKPGSSWTGSATPTASTARSASPTRRCGSPQDDPRAATAALAPVLDGSAPVAWQNGLAQAYVLEAIARDALGDSGAADRALERALDLAEPDGLLLPFLLHPAPGLLDRHARHPHRPRIPARRDPRPCSPEPSRRRRRRAAAAAEPLSDSEIRVLRYLPTNLTAPEIARELYVSPNTVKTHIRHLYAKLGTHHRAEAVERARALGLLAPSRTAPATVKPRTLTVRGWPAGGHVTAAGSPHLRDARSPRPPRRWKPIWCAARQVLADSPRRSSPTALIDRKVP